MHQVIDLFYQRYLLYNNLIEHKRILKNIEINILKLQGHSAPILYAAWAEAGLFPASDLLNLRKIDCDLEGHPTPV